MAAVIHFFITGVDLAVFLQVGLCHERLAAGEAQERPVASVLKDLRDIQICQKLIILTQRGRDLVKANLYLATKRQ